MEQSDIGDEEELLRYTPFVKGFSVTTVSRLLIQQSELLARLQSNLGYTQATFERLVLPAVTQYAAFVHHLPASESHHYRGSGGLLHHAKPICQMKSSLRRVTKKLICSLSCYKVSA